MPLLFDVGSLLFAAGVVIVVVIAVGLLVSFLLSREGSKPAKRRYAGKSNRAQMAIIGILLFKEPAKLIRVSGIVLSLLGLFLLRYSPAK